MRLVRDSLRKGSEKTRGRGDNQLPDGCHDGKQREVEIVQALLYDLVKVKESEVRTREAQEWEDGP